MRWGTDMTTKLERLLEKEAQLKAQIQQAKAAERTLEKKRDTRRKILVGAAVMARVDSGRWPKEDLLEMMDGFLSRPNERELFGLSGGDEFVAEQSVVKNGEAKQSVKQMEIGNKTKKKARRLPEPMDELASEFNL